MRRSVGHEYAEHVSAIARRWLGCVIGWLHELQCIPMCQITRFEPLNFGIG